MKLLTGRLFSRVRDIFLFVALLSLVYACDMASLSSSQGGSGSSGGTTTGTGTGNGTSNSPVLNNPGGGVPLQAAKPAPPPNTFQGCPSAGDGGDPRLNARKDRTDSAPWYPVSTGSILALQWPVSVQQKPRAVWSASDAAAIARYEGIPIQIEGWLAGAKQQGSESCNCHSVNDVDYHLWIVDSAGKNRAESVVAEVTPRLRALHPGWAFSRIQRLVDGRTKVRISGWLMMDQEHPDQVGKTRGTIWELHPIIAFDVQSGGNWVSLDTGKASNTSTQASDAAPTPDPSLPPPITDPIQDSSMPTPTAITLGGAGNAGGVAGDATSNGPVQIQDIFYNGVKGANEPDEFVEIANKDSQPVNMDGWVLHDIYGGQDFTWHGYTLQGQAKIRVYTNETHSESGGFSFGSSNAIWANKGDAAELRDATGNVVSTFSYGGKK